jgi:UDP-3-O-[3-hydroxymyristoyl] glucosamine N-acyltransferase
VVLGRPEGTQPGASGGTSMSTLSMTLQEVRDLIGEGEIVGEAGFRCRAVASLDRAEPDQLSFVRDERYVKQARRSRAGALLVPSTIEGSAAQQLVVDHPFPALLRILQHIAERKRRQPVAIDPRAVISEDVDLGTEVTVGAGAVIREAACLGDRCVIYPNVYVGQRSVIGPDTVIHPNVVVMEDVTVGARVVIHGGSVIGADGYGYLQHQGRQLKIPQVGAIEIGDDVEIGALVTVDRAALDTTIIGRGTKIGDFVHVAHNCVVGEDVLLLPTVAISGSARIGDRALLAGRAAVSDNVTIGEGAVLGGDCVTYKDVDPGAVMWGNPARKKGEQMRIQAALGSLPQMRRELRTLRQKLDRS